MRVRVIGPRLSQGEVRELGRCARQLAAAAGILKSTSWAGAPAVLVMVEQVYEGIAPIYNRGEPCLKEFREGRLTPPPIEPPAEPSTPDQLSLEAPAPAADAEA